MLFTFIIFAIVYLLFIGYAMTAPALLEKKYLCANIEEAEMLPNELKNEYILDMQECQSNINKLTFITAAAGVLVMISIFL